MDRRAVDLALQLAQMPTLAAAMRAQPLPADTLVLIKIAAGCTDTLRESAAVANKHPRVIKEAAIFYLQQVLLAPDADSYRVLGVSPGASRQKMRDHMRWMVKWLHPDRNPNEWESVFAQRVTTAWRALSSSRGPVPAALWAHAQSEIRTARRSRPTQRWIALPLRGEEVTRRKALGRIAGIFLVGVGLVLLPSLPGGSWLAATATAFLTDLAVLVRNGLLG